MIESARVSVVIPTHRRPRQVLRAIHSALAQTAPPLEILTVLDSPDPDTRAALADLEPPVRTIELHGVSGSAHARNAGIAAAQGDWIALLDDDDEWLPNKLERQLAALAGLGGGDHILTCRVFCRTGERELTLPRHPPRTGEPLGDYLFVHDAADGRSGLAQTSTLLAPKRLFERVPFDPELRRHQDPDWLLRAAAATGAKLHVVWEPLVVWVLGAHERISGHADWRHALEFARSRRGLLSARAFSSFLLSQVARQAREQHAPHAQPLILWNALSDGAPTPADLLWFGARALVPARLKPPLRGLLGLLER